ITAEERAKLQAYIVSEVPADATKIDINYDNKLHIVGVKVDPSGPVAPGSEVKLRYYWRCDEPPGKDWLLYTHVLDPVTGKIENLDFNGPIREGRGDKHVMGPASWERGKIYVDEQTLTVPSWDGMGPELMVRTGLWKGDERMRILSGPTDGTNGGIVARIPTGKKAADTKPKGAVPELRVPKLKEGQAIVIDGKGDDKAWAEAASTGPFVDVTTGEANTSFPVNGSAKLLWDDKNLYVLAEVSDPDLSGGFKDPKAEVDRFTTTGQPKLWTGDTVELMVDPDGDGDNVDYYELQINTQNKVFHTQYDGYNTPKTDPNGPFGHEEWDPKLTSAVVLKGTLDKPDDKDEGYTVEFSVPWAAFTKAKKAPPQSGDTWRMNLYAMQKNSGVAWSAIMRQGNFHKASRFAKVTFFDPAAPAVAVLGDAGAPPIDAGTSKLDAGARKLDAGAAAAGPADAGRRGTVK
ncbi:MAG: hypothetical protein EOO74_08810, partial [Myxococcales bacterium]